MLSASEKKWSLKPSNNQKILSIMQQYSLSEVVARILCNLEVALEDIPDFLSPKLRNIMPDPYLLLDMQKAVDRIITAISTEEKICVFGDYDVDGATSSALLKSYFRDIGIEIDVYIPDRILEGYGPTAEAMKKIKDSGARLVITVDCGTSAFDALKAAKELELDVIVIDHHLSSEALPEAVAIVNPNRLDETFPYNNIAAVAVSFLFLVALQARLQDSYTNLPNLLNYLDLVALGTVCDVMPLTGLNRAFVKQGIRVMQQRKRQGLSILADIAGVKEEISCYHLGFVLGPRINAGGRVGEASLGSKLLSETDYYRASEYAEKLERFNEERKTIETKLLEEAFFEAEKQADKNLIFIIGRDWHPGVIGIIASRIKDKFHKPTAVIAMSNGIGKASCRSITGVDLGAKVVMAKLEGLLVAGGGHKMAAGFTVEETKIQELFQFLDQQLANEMQNIPDQNVEFYDYEVSIDGANLKLIQDINSLGPFGNGANEPVVHISDLFVLRAKVVGNKHISCTLAADRTGYGSKTIQAIAFGSVGTKLGDMLMSQTPHKISAIGILKINLWQDREIEQLVIKDLLVHSYESS